MNPEIHYEAMSERDYRYNWRLGLSELQDTIGGYDRASLEMQLETNIE